MNMNLLRRSFRTISWNRSRSGQLLSLNRMFCAKPSNNVDGSKYPVAAQQEKSVDKKQESESGANGVEKKEETQYEWIVPYKDDILKPPPIARERLDAYKIAVDMAEANNFSSGVQISSFNHRGFRLNEFIHALGPVILFPKSVFQWKIEGPESITADSLSIVSLIEPKIETLIISYAQKRGTADYAGKAMLEISHKYKINVEVLPIDIACTQFNEFITDGRMVAAALIPPYNIVLEDQDSFDTMAFDDKQPTWDLMKGLTMGEPKVKVLKRKE